MTQVQIANKALMKIGTRRIASLTEDSKGARACNEYYDVAVDEVLSQHDWACATERQSLATLATDNFTEYAYKYQIPTSPYCLRIIELLDSDYQPSDPPYEWRREGQVLYSDLATPVLRYVGRPDSPDDLDVQVCEAIATLLAQLVCIDVSGDAQKANAILGLTAYALDKAIRHDQATKSDANDDLGESTKQWIDAGVEGV